MDVTSKSAAAVVMAIKRKTHEIANKPKASVNTRAAISENPSVQEKESEMNEMQVEESPIMKNDNKRKAREVDGEKSPKKKKTSEKDMQYYMNPMPQNHLMEKA